MKDSDFDALVRRHVGAMSAYAMAMCGDRHVADEAVQLALVKAWKYLDSFDSRGSFEGWLLRICRNCLVDLTRARRAAEPATEPQLMRPPDEAHELLDLVGRLPIAQREVVVLCGLLGYDYDGAAAFLGVPVGTVRSRLSRGRKAIAEMIRGAESEASA